MRADGILARQPDMATEPFVLAAQTGQERMTDRSRTSKEKIGEMMKEEYGIKHIRILTCHDLQEDAA